MNTQEEIKRIIANKEQAMNRYSERAQIAMKFEIKILKQALGEIESYERKIRHYEKYYKQLEEDKNKLSIENEELKLKEGDLFFESTIKQKNKYIKQLETENANLSKINDRLRSINGTYQVENWKLQEEVEHGRFYENERAITNSALKMVCESILITHKLAWENEELKIHIRSLLSEGKNYDVGG